MRVILVIAVYLDSLPDGAQFQTNVLLSFNVLFTPLKHLYVSSLRVLVQIHDKYLRLVSLCHLYI